MQKLILFLVLLMFANDPLSAADKSKELKRSSREVKKMIKEAGREKPDWWDNVQLNYPQSLDFQTIVKAKGGWNNRKNVGQWIWDVINPNDKKWKEGVKTIHLIKSKLKSDKTAVQKANMMLGRMYHDLLQDYARAAYYYEEAGVGKAQAGFLAYTSLGNCYLQLGNKKMAESLVKPIRSDRSEHGLLIQLYADMGDFKKATKLANDMVKVNQATGLLKLGDLCRLQEQYDEALKYYQQAAQSDKKKSNRRYDETVRRAKENIKAITLFEQFDLNKTKDGTYTDKSYAYNGDLHVTVKVSGGKIDEVKVTKHREKQYYASLEEMPRKIIEKQGVKGVDATLGATITAEAILNATAKAVNQGRQ